MQSLASKYREGQYRASLATQSKRIVIFAADSGFGKTTWLLNETIRLLNLPENHGKNAIILSDTFANLKYAFGDCWDSLIHQKKKIEHGSTIYFVEADSKKWMSMEGAVVAIDMYKRIDPAALPHIIRRSRVGTQHVLLTDFPEFYEEPVIIYG